MLYVYFGVALIGLLEQIGGYMVNCMRVCKSRTKASKVGWENGKPVPVLGSYMGEPVVAVPVPDPINTVGYIWVFTWKCKQCGAEVRVSFDNRYEWDVLCPNCHLEKAQKRG